MADKQWRNVGQVTELHAANSGRILIEHLARAVAELDLLPSLLEQMQVAVAAAIQRAWQSDTDRAVHLTVAASVLQAAAGHKAHNWGFFLVEKRLEATADRRIEVLLYPEGS